MSMNAPWEEEVVLSDAQTHTVDSNALAQWDSSDWDLGKNWFIFTSSKL